MYRFSHSKLSGYGKLHSSKSLGIKSNTGKFWIREHEYKTVIIVPLGNLNDIYLSK